MKTPAPYDYDVIVVGAGISGLGAALRLKDAGLNVCVLEKDDRVGGRLSTDRINGFVVDRGATIFGGRFHDMKRLIKRLRLEQHVEYFNFAFGLQDATSLKKIRRARIDDLLFSNRIGFKAKLALLRFGIEVLLRGRKLGHGKSCDVSHLDTESVQEYLTRIGGKELLDNVLLPGLNGPLGGNLRNNSKLILFQTFWNILLMRTWAIKGGMDAITEAMRKELDVRTGCEVNNISIPNRASSNAAETVTSSAVEKCSVTCTNALTFTAPKIIIALPGNLVPAICPALPADVKQLLAETAYGKMVNAHVLLDRPTKTGCAGYGVSKELGCGFEIELEHNRVQGLCPPGKGLASVYMWDEGEQIVTTKTDDEVKQRAEKIVRTRFPECGDAVTGTHVLRWTNGIAHFPPGRLTQLCALRKRMASWELPVQLCGDYLDGIASESALATGEEAAGRVRSGE